MHSPLMVYDIGGEGYDQTDAEKELYEDYSKY